MKKPQTGQQLAIETRESLGLNQEAMSVLMGVHRQTWVKWERGENRMPHVARRLCGVLKWMHEKKYLEEFLTP